MGKHHLRHEKDCLNCGATVDDRYCPHCGQENTEPAENFSHLVRHFFDDVTHYDSHLFTSFKDLVIRPGFLTRQYNAGKRVAYLNPIRMYIFISAVFFLVFFSVNKSDESKKNLEAPRQAIFTHRQRLADSIRALVKTKARLTVEDETRNKAYQSLAAQLDTPKVKSSGDETLTIAFNNAGELVLAMENQKYKSAAEYDAAQRKLSDTAREGLVGRYVEKKVIRLVNEQGSDGKAVVKQSVAHDIPKVMFLLLPLFALYISFFYSRKKFLYSQHAIFSLHFHSFLFLCLFLLCLISLANPSLYAWLIIAGVFDLTVFVYLVAALRNAYGDTFLKAIFKAFGISLLYILSLILVNLVVMAIVFMLL